MEGLKYDFCVTRLLTGSHPTILYNLGVNFSFLILIIAKNSSFLAKIDFKKKSKIFFSIKITLIMGWGNNFDLLAHINDARV